MLNYKIKCIYKTSIFSECYHWGVLLY